MRVWVAVLPAWLGFAGSALAENRRALFRSSIILRRSISSCSRQTARAAHRGDEGRSIKLWDAASGRLLRTFTGHATAYSRLRSRRNDG